MWWTRCDVFVDERLAIFACTGCRECEMTPAHMALAEITSAYARFKQTHRYCVREEE
jgi:hypothetical protein